MHHHTPYVSII